MRTIPPPSPTPFIQRPYAALFLIAFMAAIAYSNTFTCSFHFDDISSIVDNPAIRDLGDPGAIWRFMNRRFIGNLSFALNYRLHGLDVTGYHIFNLIVHIAASLLAWNLARLMLKTPALKSMKYHGARQLIPLFAGLIFALHPLQTQAVTYIVQRLASMSTMFYLAAINFYILGRLTSGGRRTAALVSMGAAALLGLFTKETVATLPLAVLLCELIFFRTRSRLRNMFTDWRPIAGIIAGAAFLCILPYLFEFSIRGALGTVPSQRPGDPLLTPAVYLITQTRVLITYLRLLAVPYPQNFDYDFPASHGFFEPAVIASSLVLLVLFVTGARLIKRRPLISFGILWFFLTLSVESSIKPLGNVIYEHRLYLPMFGFAAAAADIAAGALKNRRNVLIILIAATSLVYGGMTFARNRVWRDDIILWSDVVAKSPLKSRPYTNLGEAYDSAGMQDTALEMYNKAYELNPENPETLNNIGFMRFESGKYAESLDYYKRALDLSSPRFPNYALFAVNRAAAHLELGQYDEAVEWYSIAADLNSLKLPALLGAAQKLIELGKHAEAMPFLETALHFDPGNGEANKVLGILLLEDKRAGEALKYFMAANESLPGDVSVAIACSTILSEQGKPLEALPYVESALNLDPDNYRAHIQASMCYRMIGDENLAERHLREASRLMNKVK